MIVIVKVKPIRKFASSYMRPMLHVTIFLFFNRNDYSFTPQPLFSLLSLPAPLLLDKCKEWWDEIDVGQFFFLVWDGWELGM